MTENCAGAPVRTAIEAGCWEIEGGTTTRTVTGPLEALPKSLATRTEYSPASLGWAVGISRVGPVKAGRTVLLRRHS